VWDLKEPGKTQSWWFIVVEALITTSIIAEIIFRWLSTGNERFWSSFSNIFDFIVAVLCGIALFVYAFRSH